MQHDEENKNRVQATLRLSKAIHDKVTELAKETGEPMTECYRVLLMRGLAETTLPTVTILRAQIQALAELIYIVREMNSDNIELLERAKIHGATMAQKIFASLGDA